MAPTPEPAARAKSKLPLIVAAITAILGMAGSVAFLKKGGDEVRKEASASEPEPTEPGVVELSPFVLNLSDPEGDRFLRTTLRILLDRSEVAAAASVEGLEHTRLRDCILRVLATKNAYDLASYEGKERLRSELRAAVTPLFEEARVLDVYFIELLVQ